MRVKYLCLMLAAAIAICAATRVAAQDSASVAGAPDSAGMADSVAVTTDQAAAVQDTTAPVLAGDSLATGADSTASAADSLAGQRARQSEVQERQRRARASRAGVIETRVIPWDWDQYTNVIAVGLKNLKDSTEYSLTRNTYYDSLYARYQGKIVDVRGRVTRDRDGFYNMTVSEIVPPDTTTVKNPGGVTTP